MTGREFIVDNVKIQEPIKIESQISKDLRETLECVQKGDCNSQALFNAWNKHNLQPHESGSYCGACVERLINRVINYIANN